MLSSYENTESIFSYIEIVCCSGIIINVIAIFEIKFIIILGRRKRAAQENESERVTERKYRNKQTNDLIGTN